MRNRILSAILACCAAALACACATAPAAKSAPAPSASTEPVAAPSQETAASPAPETATQPITWTDEAKAAFDAEVPGIVKKVARKKMEQKARERGLTVIDMVFYEEVKKEQMGG